MRCSIYNNFVRTQTKDLTVDSSRILGRAAADLRSKKVNNGRETSACFIVQNKKGIYSGTYIEKERMNEKRCLPTHTHTLPTFPRQPIDRHSQTFTPIETNIAPPIHAH